MTTIKLDKPFMGETEWDLDGYLVNLRGDALKQAARDLGITFKSKTPVAELREAIRAHYVSVAEVSEPDHVPADQAEWDRHVTETLPADSPERTPATPQQASDTLSESSTLLSVDPGQTTGIAAVSVHESGVFDTETVARVLGESREPAPPMGLHFRGRGMGAKHWALIRQAQIDRLYGDAEPIDPFTTRNDFTHTPNSERVQKYVRRAATHNGERIAQVVPRLTYRQMRRVRRNANKHAEGFTYGGQSVTYPEFEGLSLLARTPQGEGIYYRFANA